jgi:hypothetical protein
MTINTLPTSLAEIMNTAPPGSIADAFRLIQIGSVVRALRTTLRNKSPNAALANPYVTAGLQVLTLPDDAKADVISRAYARTGTGTKGPLTVVASDSYAGDPGAHSIVVSPTGDLVFHAADAYTSVDVAYEPMKYDIKELTLPAPTSGVVPLPTVDVAAGVVFIAEAEGNFGLAGDTNLVVNLPGTAAATGKAALDLAKANVVLNAGDNFTQVRVKYGVIAGQAGGADVDTLLEAQSPIL